MIGIFDSGIGGISIAMEIRKKLPGAPIAYYADSAYCPYGELKADAIKRRARKIVTFLIREGASIVVVACNTATVAAIDYLRSIFNIPFVGIVPAVKLAVATKQKKIAVLSSNRTSKETLYHDLIDGLDSESEISTIGSQELIAGIENNKDEEVLEDLIKKAVEPFRSDEIQVIVLGCTHFPLIKNLFEKVLGSKYQVIDSGDAVAKQAACVYKNNNSEEILKDKFYTSGDPGNLQEAIKKYMKMALKVKQINL